MSPLCHFPLDLGDTHPVAAVCRSGSGRSRWHRAMCLQTWFWGTLWLHGVLQAPRQPPLSSYCTISVSILSQSGTCQSFPQWGSRSRPGRTSRRDTKRSGITVFWRADWQRGWHQGWQCLLQTTIRPLTLSSCSIDSGTDKPDPRQMSS